MKKIMTKHFLLELITSDGEAPWRGCTQHTIISREQHETDESNFRSHEISFDLRTFSILTLQFIFNFCNYIEIKLPGQDVINTELKRFDNCDWINEDYL